jgi:hypothetical protein
VAVAEVLQEILLVSQAFLLQAEVKAVQLLVLLVVLAVVLTQELQVVETLVGIHL